MNRSGQLGLLIALSSLLVCRLHGQMPLSSAKSYCSLSGVPAKGAGNLSDGDLLALYNAQSDLVNSLAGDALVSATAMKRRGGSARMVAATIQFQAPALLRMTGFVPFLGSREFDLASDGHEFRLLIPVDRKMKFFVGPVDAPATSTDAKQNLRPQPIIDAFHWPRGELDASAGARLSSRMSRTLNLLLSDASGKRRKGRVKFDMATGTVSSLEVSSPEFGLVIKIRYGDWEEVENISDNVARCYPRQITISQPKDGVILELQILHSALNAQISAARFVLNPPRGISVVSLNLSGGADAP